MSDGSKIEWTDATVNVINGCSLASPGCTHCYAMKQAHRFPVRQGLTTQSKGGMVWTGEVRFHEPALLQVLRWKRPRRIFWNAHGDMFHENVPDEWIDRCFAVMALTPQHQHQVLTKRSARMREWVADRKVAERLGECIVGGAIDMTIRGGTDPELEWPDPDAPARLKVWPLPNVWLGVSVEDQQRADERIPDLLATSAAVRFLSCEPLLGPVDLTAIRMHTNDALGFDAVTGAEIHKDDRDRRTAGQRIDWVIAGGESGPQARPMHPDWACALRDQCADAGVPFFFKQWGEWAASGTHNRETVIGGPQGAWHPRYQTRWIANSPKAGRTLVAKVGKKAAGRLLDGVEHNGMPGHG